MQRREDHPHGEDSIRCKVRILRGLEALNPRLTARLIVIDDECPNESGRMADQILREYGKDHASEKYRTLFLGEAIDARESELPPGMTHKYVQRRSVKGGAVLYGMRKALKDSAGGLHLLVDNDADLSVHQGIPLARRGIAYVDSEAASTQDGAEITENYLSQVRQMARRT